MSKQKPKTLSLVRLLAFLNRELAIDKIKDSSLNGLQVGFAQPNQAVVIKKIGFAVDASLSTFKAAKNQGCNLLVVHHGLFWSREIPITGVHYKRLRFLMENEIGLFAAHLPLDLHGTLGNNAEICKALQLKKCQPFGFYHGTPIGFAGELTPAMSISEFGKWCEKKIGTACGCLPFGPKQVKRVGVVSGGGSSTLGEAIELGLDALVTGEGVHHNYHEAFDAGMTVVYGTHYHTETFGVKALAGLINKKFGVQTVFLDVRVRVP